MASPVAQSTSTALSAAGNYSHLDTHGGENDNKNHGAQAASEHNDALNDDEDNNDHNDNFEDEILEDSALNLNNERDDENEGDRVLMSVQEGIDRVGMGLFQYELLCLSGLCFASDAMEVLLLSFLSIVLVHEWGITENESAFLTSILFIGAMAGSFILGSLADRLGRRPAFILTSFIISGSGLASAFSPNYITLVFLLFCVGIGVGGITIPYDTLAEFLPNEGRGKILNMTNYFWTMGSLFVIVLAYIFLGGGAADSQMLQFFQQYCSNWRLFVGFSAVPCLLVTTVSFFWVPESAQWLCSQNRPEEALKVLKKVAKVNGHSNDDIDSIFPPNVHLVGEEHEESADIADLLQPRWRCITLLLWGVWFGFGFGYYGTIMAVTRVFDNDPGDGSALRFLKHSDTEGNLFTSGYNNTEYEDDLPLSSSSSLSSTSYGFDFGAIFLSSSAELVGTTFVIFFIDRFGRVMLQVAAYSSAGLVVSMLCGLPSLMETPPYLALLVLGFLARVFEMIATCTTWTATAELLPTEMRSTGHSAANAVARIGALFSPFVVDDMSLLHIGIIIFICNVCVTLCASQLPETAGRNMGDHGGNNTHTEVPSDETYDETERSGGGNDDDNDVGLSNNSDRGLEQPTLRGKQSNGIKTSHAELL